MSVHFALGARDGNPVEQLRDGLARLAAQGVEILALSSLWETEPVDLPPGGPVYNAAATGRTLLSPEGLLSLFHATEEALGRRRGDDAWRSLDLDILLAGERVRTGPGLELPHPRFHRRRFNLAPLAEIAPGARHPLLGRTVADLLAACDDPAWVRRLEGSWSPLHPSGGSGKIAALPRSLTPGTPVSP